MLSMYPGVHAVVVPGTVYGAVLNFHADLAGMAGQLTQPPYAAPPRAPVLYIKPANTWIADGGTVALPAAGAAAAGGADRVQVAATIGLVIGSVASRVTEADALRHVRALRIVNDMTLPHDSVYRPAIRQRCRDGFCPIGPETVPTGGAGGISALLAGCRPRTLVDGVLRHEWAMADLVRGPARLLADVSEFMTLWPGDVLLLGTPRAAPLAGAGQRVRVEVAGLGSVESTLIADAALAA